MANESLLITMLPDGTYHVKETEPAGDQDTTPAIDQSVQSPDDVSALVSQWLQAEGQDDQAEASSEDASDGGADDASESPDGAPAAPTKSAWNAEAKKRDPASGMRM